MTPDPLLPDLLALERELAARARPEPSAELRSRVLTMARREWTVPRPDPVRRDFGRFAAATAAAVLLAINLSASLANNTDWHLSGSSVGPDIAEVAGRIRELAPDIPKREARRQAVLLRATANLTPAPAPVAPADRTLWHKELERWGTR